MKKTEKRTIKKTVQKVIPVITFNENQLLALLFNINCAKPAEVTQITLPGSNVRKTNNPYYNKENKSWNVEKVSVLNGMFGTDYEKGVKKATDDPEFQAQEHKWARHWRGSKVLMVNKKEVENPTKFYAAFRPLRPDSVTWRFVDTKTPLSDEQVTELKSFITKRDSGPIVWRTVTTTNIQAINIDKIKYQRI